MYGTNIQTVLRGKRAKCDEEVQGPRLLLIALLTGLGLSQNVPLQHEDYFDLKATKATRLRKSFSPPP